MRILHTSDWHLGKRLFKLDRSPEHELFLSWLIDTIKEKNVDVLLIAGDIFDVPTPPHQSLEMFYNFLNRVSTETKTQTLIIAGNHDSGLLLEAPAKILAPHRVKVWGKLSPDVTDHWITIEKDDEKVDVCALPFFRSYEILPQGEGDALAALKTYLERPRTYPQLLMLHHLAGVFESAGSEQVISLSGVDSIPIEILRSFDYVALGHIHKPQKVGAQTFYSGSPIPLRFSETLGKSVVMVDCKKGVLTSELHPIPKFRALFIVKATEQNWRDKIKALEGSSELKPVVEVQISLNAPVMGLIDEIKSSIEAKGYELLSYLPSFGITEKKERRSDKLFELSTENLFVEFYATKFPDAPEIPADLMNDFKTLLEKVHAPPRN